MRTTDDRTPGWHEVAGDDWLDRVFTREDGTYDLDNDLLFVQETLDDPHWEQDPEND